MGLCQCGCEQQTKLSSSSYRQGHNPSAGLWVKEDIAPTQSPTIRDIAWAAGIFEGEGSCRRDGPNGRGTHAEVGQKDPELLHRLRALFGGNVWSSSTKDYHVWHLGGARARAFLLTIYTELTQRRRRQVCRAVRCITEVT